MKNKKENKKLIDSFLEVQSTDNYKEIFDILLDSENDLEIKTHIVNPIATTLLQFYSESLKLLGYIQPSELVNVLLSTFFKHMISYKRMSRTEILNAISYSIDNENTDLSLKEKLRKNMTKL